MRSDGGATYRLDMVSRQRFLPAAVAALIQIVLWSTDANAIPVTLPDPAFPTPLCTPSNCEAGIISQASARTTVYRQPSGSEIDDMDDFEEAFDTALVSAAASLDNTLIPDTITFDLTASASSRTTFGTHRGRAFSALGGEETREDGEVQGYTAHASATSFWQDVWTFTADGTFSATMTIHSLLPGGVQANGYDVFYDAEGAFVFSFEVWEQFCDDFFFGGCIDQWHPAKKVDAENIGTELSAVDTSVPVSFDYKADRKYVVQSYFSLATSGKFADFSETVQVSNVALTAGTLNSLSNTDWLAVGAPAAPVPEPATSLLALQGLAVMCAVRRWRKRRR
jgi:hypothetical protein